MAEPKIAEQKIAEQKIADLIDKFKLYRTTHPNLANCWIAYLGLKKRHYDENDIKQCCGVLNLFEKGCHDLKEKDIVGILLYKQSV
jgi:hypothetical protein